MGKMKRVQLIFAHNAEHEALEPVASGQFLKIFRIIFRFLRPLKNVDQEIERRIKLAQIPGRLRENLLGELGARQGIYLCCDANASDRARSR